MAAVEGFISHLERWVVFLAVEILSLFGLNFILCLPAGIVGARKSVDVGSERYIMGVALFASDVVILACVALDLFSRLDTIQTHSRAR